MTPTPDAFWTRTSLEFNIVRPLNNQSLLPLAPAMIQCSVVLPLLILFLSVTPVGAQSFDSTRDDVQLFQQEPDTPGRLVRATVLASRLNHTQLAQQYLHSLLEEGLSGEALRQLRSELGVGVFLRLNSNVDLQPMAGQLLKQINKASVDAAVAPDAAALIAQLGTGRVQTLEAASKLLEIGSPVAKALLTADIQLESGRLANQLLRQHPRTFRDGLMDALPDVDSEQTVRGLQVLAMTVDAELAPLLLKYEFASDNKSVQHAAASVVDRLWNVGDRPNNEREAVAWLTAASAKHLAEAADRFSPGSVDSLKQAVRFAELAVVIDQDQQSVAAATLLACQAVSSTGDVPGDLKTRQIALEIALDAGHGTAVAALLNSDPDVLRRATTMSTADVRVKAAAELLKLNQSGPGAVYALQVIHAAASGSLSAEAVVIDPRLDAATEATWLLNDLGYEATRCSTGQAGFQRAVAQLQCELILIHSNCLRWPLSETIANLRADSRTAQTPIAVYGPRRDEVAIHLLQRRYPGVSYLPGPLSAINFVDELRRSQVPGPLLAESERSELIQQARVAADL